MHKYLAVFAISFQQEFAYRMNFIMWRIRNVLQVLVTYFLWTTLFATSGRQLFGYTRETIITYVLGLLFIRAAVLSAKAQDVAGEIARGDLSNYLVKPINYFKYWLTRDIATKSLNISFAFAEMTILWLLLKPTLFFQTEVAYLILFIIALFLAMFIFFILLFITNAIPFWAPEVAWGGHFLVTVILIEFLSGALFPLDILPQMFQSVLHATPFPYLVFFPLQIYLGKVPYSEALTGVLVAFFWVIMLYFLMTKIWARGLKAYQAYGK